MSPLSGSTPTPPAATPSTSGTAEPAATRTTHGTHHGGHHAHATHGGHHGAHHAAAVDPQAGLDALSSALGTTSADLTTRMTDGTGITDLLDAHPEVAAKLAADQSKGAVVDGYA